MAGGSRQRNRGLQTLAQGSLALARTHATEAALENIENQLEKEIAREEAASKSVKPLARVRHKGQKFLHSKHVLLVIVGLNVLDCILVLGELILDVHFVVDLLETSDKQSQQFLNAIEEKYPDVPPVNDIEGLYSKLLLADISWNSKKYIEGRHGGTSHGHKRDLVHTNGSQTKQPQSLGHSIGDDEQTHYRKNNTGSLENTAIIPIKNVQEYDLQNDFNARDKIHGNNTDAHGKGHGQGHHEHSIEEEIAHGLHKASITILAILVVETAIKVFCEGMRIFERKMEVFDSVIVVVSFTLDLVFIKGLTMFPIQKYVFILAFLVPWRVIRVVNSLIVAVMDHGHFRLKLLYSQKKKISASLKATKQELKSLQVGLEGIKKLCTEAGIPEWKLQQCIVGENNNHGSSKTVSPLAFFGAKSTAKRRGNEPRQEMNGKGIGKSSKTAVPPKVDTQNSFNQPTKDGITRNSSSTVMFDIDESNESTELMNNRDEPNSP